MKWLWIIEKHGDNYPYFNKNDKNFKGPDPELWIKNPLHRLCAYVENDDYLYFGYYTSANCFFVESTQNLKETHEAFKRSQSHFKVADYFTQAEIQEIQDKQWQYMDNIEAEQFYFDTEQITEEGFLTQTCYFPNNSIKSRTIIDLDTGELIYHCHWVKGQYYDENIGKFVSVEREFYRQHYDKYIKTEKQYVKKYKRYKWVITQPASYKGKLLEEVYGYQQKLN